MGYCLSDCFFEGEEALFNSTTLVGLVKSEAWAVELSLSSLRDLLWKTGVAFLGANPKEESRQFLSLRARKISSLVMVEAFGL
jgi:hypothetical protein